MTSSGTYNFALSDGECVLEALSRCMIRAPEIRQEHMASARRNMNLLLAELANRQVNLWKVELITQALTQGTATYSVPSRVIMILDSFRSLNYGTTDQTDIYTTPISRTEYASYAAKETQGPPIVYWFDRLISPTVTFYPVPDGNGPYTWAYYACTQMQDANLPGGETPDVPYYALSMLTAGLTYYLSQSWPPEGSISEKLAFQQAKLAEFNRTWQSFASTNTETVNMSLQPAIGAYYRRA